MSLKIVTLNVRGLKNRKKRKSVFQCLTDNQIDIALLQETYCTVKDKNTFSNDWDGKCYHSVSDSNHSRGVVTLLNKQFIKQTQYKLINTDADRNGRRILITFSLQNVAYNILNIYAPNQIAERDKFFTNTYKYIHDNALQNVIIGGDFNYATAPIDRANSTSKLRSKTYENMIEKLDIIDIWRNKNPGNKKYRYIDPSNRGFSSRLDKFLITSILSQNVTKCEIKQAPSPDHKALIIQLQEKTSYRGKCSKRTSYTKQQLKI